MTLNIILDYREHKLISYFSDAPTQNLDIGDILFVDNDQTIKYIVERKTLDDMSSSIIDGRYREQKSRLLASNYKIIYILEGFNKNNFGVKYSTILSAMLNLQFRDNITVIRTKDVKETAEILILLKEKLKLSQETKFIEYASNINISKKQNLTKDIVFKKQLSCIPGISDKIAQDIMNVYPSLKDLILEYSKLDILKAEKLLTKIDGIGNIISKKVFNFLF